MNAEGKWIVTIMATGAFIGHIIWRVINYLIGTEIADACLIAFVIGILLVAPSYSDVDDYWRKKYGS